MTIALTFTIEAQDAYDEKILELVKTIKAAGGHVHGAQERPQQAMQTGAQATMRPPGGAVAQLATAPPPPQKKTA